jgi:glycyl-tRNA synthetase
MSGKKTETSLQEEIIDVCLRRGIIFPSAEIYGGLSGYYEFGPVGELIRENIVALWKQKFIKSEENIFQISGSLTLPEKVFEASGHLSTFNDPLTQCSGKCKSMFRIDHLLEEHLEEKYDGKPLDEMYQVLKGANIVCPTCKGELTEPRQFNLMFQTEVGASSGNKAYLRPETAQNIFLNFRRISHAMRAQLPFGISQVGKAFRNEIAPRNFLIRLREFEQMEIEMFVDPEELNNHPRWEEVADFPINILSHENQKAGKKAESMTVQEAMDKGIIKNQYLGYYLALEADFVEEIGIDPKKFWFRHLMDEEVAHYSKANYDLEIEFPFGIVECIGNAYRTDYDLTKHEEKSKTKMHVVTKDGRKVIPHVIEPSFGVDRLFYAILLSAYQKEGRDWTWFKFPMSMTPWEVVVAPLMKKDGLKEYAYNLFWQLKDEGLDGLFDESGAIGKRYARADEVGIPFVVTVDYDSLEDDTITLRFRDTTEQIRVPIDEIGSVIQELAYSIITWDDAKEDYKLIE